LFAAFQHNPRIIFSLAKNGATDLRKVVEFDLAGGNSESEIPVLEILSNILMPTPTVTCTVKIPILSRLRLLSNVKFNFKVHSIHIYIKKKREKRNRVASRTGVVG